MSAGREPLYVHAWGPAHAPPVLLLHGVRNHGGRFRRLAADAFPDRRVLAPDLRGHGASPWEPPWDAAAHLADLLDLLDRHGVARSPVVGHSFGGLLALWLAASAPERVSALALLDPAAALPPAAAATHARADLDGEGRAGSWPSREEARAAWLAIRPASGRWAVDEDLDAFLARDADGRHRLRFSRMAAVCAWSEMAREPPSLAAFSGDVLLVTALQDAFVTDALRAGLARDLGDRLAEHGIDAGHMLFWDAPDGLAAALRRFLHDRPEC